MEVKINNDRLRSRSRKDPVVAEEGVFGCIAKEKLKPPEQARVEREVEREIESKSEQPKSRIWSIKEISKRLSDWLHLTKP